ncbi:MAG: hypothetical protein IJX62_02550, partial [Clostridia bacterium]|nr:hypothetical protein [Clostridia bacterium]
MRQFWKMILSWALVLGMLTVLLSGCNAGDTPEETTDGVEGTTTEPLLPDSPDVEDESIIEEM